MLDNQTISRIDELLHCQKLSQRQIAKQLKVSRGTVQSVANGKRKVKNAETNEKNTFFREIPSGKPQRCDQCGALTKFPCLACQLYEKELLMLVLAYKTLAKSPCSQPGTET